MFVVVIVLLIRNVVRGRKCYSLTKGGNEALLLLRRCLVIHTDDVTAASAGPTMVSWHYDASQSSPSQPHSFNNTPNHCHRHDSSISRPYSRLL